MPTATIDLQDLADGICDLYGKIAAIDTGDVSFPILVSQGGTSGITVQAARINLNVPPVDISALTGIDWRAAESFYADRSTDVTYTFSNVTENYKIQVQVRNTGGSPITPTFPSGSTGVHWPDNTLPGAIEATEWYIYSITRIGGKTSGVISGPFLDP